MGAEIINVNIAGRPYQIQAIRALMEGIEDRKRKFLLVMATGTGKTRTTITFVFHILLFPQNLPLQLTPRTNLTSHLVNDLFTLLPKSRTLL